MLATTFNIHSNILQKITEAANRLNTSQRDIIVLLLMKIMADHDRLIRGTSMVKYQHDDEGKKWHCFHIRLKNDEYEYFIDLRKVCKCSISLLIAIAVERYFEELMVCTKKHVDNYQLFNSYVFRRVVMDGIISWHMYWGYPEKELKALLL